MPHQLSQRVSRIGQSPIHVMSARANRLKAEGRDIINLTTGEPDFDTPEHIKEAARKAMQAGMTKYTAVDGTPSLKKAVIAKFARDNQLDFEPNQIIVSAGVKQGIYNLMQATLNAGDEVIIPAPYWTSYPDMVLLAEAKPVIVAASIEQNFKITAEQLASAITPRTRMIIINSPSNPSGMAYTKAEFAKLGAVLMKHPQIIIVSDDMYENILWANEPFSNILNACPQLHDQTVVFNGVSKTYAMTGWRIGYAGGPKDLIAAMLVVQSQSTSSSNSIAQAAAEVAITADQSCVRNMCEAYQARHELVYKSLKAIPGIECHPCMGTFYSFFSVQKIIDATPEINNDVELAEYLLDKANIAVVPGTAFGTPGCLRISFATSTELLIKALERLTTACQTLFEPVAA